MSEYSVVSGVLYDGKCELSALSGELYDGKCELSVVSDERYSGKSKYSVVSDERYSGKSKYIVVSDAFTTKTNDSQRFNLNLVVLSSILCTYKNEKGDAKRCCIPSV